MMENIPNVGVFQLFLAMSGYIAVGQTIIILKKREKLTELMGSLLDEYNGKTLGKDKIINERLSGKILMTLIISIVLSILGCIVVTESLPNLEVIKVNSEIFHRKYPDRVIGFLLWLPFDSSVSPQNEVTRVIVYLTIFLSVPLVAVRFSLLPVMALHLVGIFETVSSKIGKLKYSCTENTDETIIEIIKLHQKALMISKNLVEFFRPIILLKAIFSFWMFAVLMVVITEEPIGSSIFINCAFCLLCSGYELLLDCWSGEQLARKSEKVGVAAYQCQWDRMSNSARKNLVLLTLRAQRPIQLDVRPYLIPMSLKTYVQIMKASFSCYTLLLSIKAEKH
ncbi:odorant receptor 67c-like isoform X1 [Nilaparvata lugens]|uniref:odorant receptor 67c-like isoform X1 n=1 Tax=Nilaparvata lugens TaxID=108931 RepID=UPI00193E0296|nr:odorant receptor 67c-like isoform X1 [Nilaparvata lugens]